MALLLGKVKDEHAGKDRHGIEREREGVRCLNAREGVVSQGKIKGVGHFQNWVGL